MDQTYLDQTSWHRLVRRLGDSTGSKSSLSDESSSTDGGESSYDEDDDETDEETTIQEEIKDNAKDKIKLPDRPVIVRSHGSSRPNSPKAASEGIGELLKHNFSQGSKSIDSITVTLDINFTKPCKKILT